MRDIREILTLAAQKEASDIFISAGSPVVFKIKGAICRVDDDMLLPKDTNELINNLFVVAGSDDAYDLFVKTGDADLSCSLSGVGRFRVNCFRQRNSNAAVIRIVKQTLPDPKALKIPDVVMELYSKNNGLILVTGPAGSGKSTTLNCLINRMNEERNLNILTLEDPIEYLHNHKKSIVNQREVEKDTESFHRALRAALRQSPDVILVGEMRDVETTAIALTAAETGHLILSTLHTTGAANTIDRIIDVFPSNQQKQIRVQTATILQAVVSQLLIPSPTQGVVPAFEIMIVNNAIRNMIRDSKVFQIDSAIFSGASLGMQTMDMSIAELYKKGDITKDSAYLYCTNTEVMKKYIG